MRPHGGQRTSVAAQIDAQVALLAMLGPGVAADSGRVDRMLRPLVGMLARLSPSARLSALADATSRLAAVPPVVDRLRALTAARMPTAGPPAAAAGRLDALRRHIAELDALRTSSQSSGLRRRVRGKVLEACRRVVRAMSPAERDEAKDLIAKAVDARRQELAEETRA
jgi:hypothetical protein